MSDPTITQIQDNISQLRQLIDNLGSSVNKQNETMIATRADLLQQQQAAQVSDELARNLILVRRNIEDLERRIKAQQKEQEQFKALQAIGAAVNSSLELDQVLVVVMDSIISLTKSERAILLLRNKETARLEVQIARNVDKETIENSSSFEISRSIVQTVAESGEPVVTMNAQSDSRFAAQESIISYNLRSILCVPLMIKGTAIGVIYADNRVAAGVFGDADRDLLASFANQAAVAIQNARQYTEIMEMRDLMDNVFASIASGVITIDDHHRIALYNMAAERILGFPGKSIVNQSYQQALETLGLPVATLGKEFDATQKGESNTRGSEVRVLGYVTYDKTKKKLTRFDAVGIGKAWGMKRGDSRAIRVEESPWTYGLAVELVTGDSPYDLVPPYNMLHYSSTGPYFGKK